MKIALLSLFLIIFIGLAGLFIGRFLFGGNEDTWICVNNQWIKHGNPKTPIPQTGCGETKDEWQTQTVDEIGLSFKYHPGTAFRKEVAEDPAGIHAVGFYVEKGDKNNLSYTLYGVYQPNKEATEQDLEKAKKEMDVTTIKEVTIGGYKGIEGLILGPRTRYITILLKNNRLLTVSTIPPTQENKTLTDQIVKTFEFK